MGVMEPAMHSNDRAARPRILQVLYSFGIGGSEIFGLQLAKQLADQGAELLCAAIDSAPGPLLQRCAEAGIQVVDLGITTKNILRRNGISLALSRRLRELRLDAIHLQHFLGLNKLGIPARLAGVRRIVVTEHSVADVGQNRAVRTRVRLGWRLASSITVIHGSVKEYLCGELGLPRERVEVIPIGIEVEQYHREDRLSRRRELGFGSEVVFVFVGRLAPVKQVPGLVSAFLSVQERAARDSRLLVVGDGEDRGACEALIRAHPCGDRVRMVGQQADIRPYLAAADVFLMNSRSEGTPRALLEAMATGLPGIGPAVGGLPDILAGRGWLASPGSAPALQTAILSALDNPAMIEQMGARSREYVRANFESTQIATRYRRLLIG